MVAEVQKYVPGYRLKQIAAELIACKGVKHGYLTVTSAILPPIH